MKHWIEMFVSFSQYLKTQIIDKLSFAKQWQEGLINMTTTKADSCQKQSVFTFFPKRWQKNDLSSWLLIVPVFEDTIKR